jgi:hypothetical protein
MSGRTEINPLMEVVFVAVEAGPQAAEKLTERKTDIPAMTITRVKPLNDIAVCTSACSGRLYGTHFPGRFQVNMIDWDHQR